jgi:hypothetical protein
MAKMLRFFRLAAFSAAGLLVIGVAYPEAQSSDTKAKGEPKRPQLTLKATPGSAMVPVRISVAAELKGGDEDFEEYYCASIEWNWGDGTISESSNDCDPYQAGKSVILRKYSGAHPYSQGGSYRISFRLKKNDKVVGSATTLVQLLGGGAY